MGNMEQNPIDCQHILNLSLDLICIAGMDGYFKYLNPAWEKNLGYSRDELLSRPFLDFIHPDDHAKNDEEMAKLAGGYQTLHFENRYIHKDGSMRYIAWTAQAVVDEKKMYCIGRDITEHKQAKEALQESKEELKLTLDATTDGIWKWNFMTNELYFSPRYYTILGYEPDEFPSNFESWQSLIHPDDLQAARGAAEEYLKNKPDEYRSEFRLRTKSGDYRWIRTHAKVVERNEKGEAVRMIGNHEDITERKQAENMLKVNLIKYQTLFESLPIGITISDKAGNILESNKEAERLLKLPKKEHAKRKIAGPEWRIVRPDGSPMPAHEYASVKALKENRLVENVEMGILKGEGDITWINVTAIPIPLENYGVVIIYTDITERKQAEETLRESHEIIEGILNAIPVRVFWKGKNLVFLGCNALFAHDAGFADPKDIIGKDDYQMVWRDQAELYRGDDRQVMEGGVSKLFIEEPQTTPEGNTITLLTSKVPLRSSTGEISGVLGTYMDITERKRLEEELFRSQKLESVGILAGGIAHDFNNVLTTIIGNISMAKMQVSPDDEMFDLLSEAEMASFRAQALTKQLLTFAKGGALLKETASIKDILKESSLFVLRGSKSGCEFSIAEDLWLVDVDVGQMSQVINNIVINSNQAMPRGGIIQVAAVNLMIDERHDLPLKPGRYVRISVTDQGVGIAKEHLLNIFDPYFTTKQEGSGLGLATTYTIIKKHDGHITVESLLGVGTTFHIYLPASDKAVPEKEEVKLIKGQGRILVMDDESPLRKMVGRMLEKLGYESEFAKDGAEAIRLVQEAKEAGKLYDAVILDLTIPGGMGGKEAINKLLEIDPEVKAIVSSGYSDDPVLSNFQDYGFKGMMPKPFESRSLGKVLHEVLKGEKE